MSLDKTLIILWSQISLQFKLTRKEEVSNGVFKGSLSIIISLALYRSKAQQKISIFWAISIEIDLSISALSSFYIASFLHFTVRLFSISNLILQIIIGYKMKFGSILYCGIDFCIRLPLELSSQGSLMPLHSAIASARLISSLSIESQRWGLVPQGMLCLSLCFLHLVFVNADDSLLLYLLVKCC